MGAAEAGNPRKTRALCCMLSNPEVLHTAPLIFQMKIRDTEMPSVQWPGLMPRVFKDLAASLFAVPAWVEHSMGLQLPNLGVSCLPVHLPYYTRNATTPSLHVLLHKKWGADVNPEFCLKSGVKNLILKVIGATWEGDRT